MKYYILKDKKVIGVDLMTWAKWFETNKKDSILKHTILENGKFISTAFLGIDHGWGLNPKPLLFETMVFPQKGEFSELDMDRYTSYKEAMAGHQVMVDKWK